MSILPKLYLAELYLRFINLNIQNTFTKENPTDPVLENTRRQVFETVFSYVNPKKTSNPK